MNNKYWEQWIVGGSSDVSLDLMVISAKFSLTLDIANNIVGSSYYLLESF